MLSKCPVAWSDTYDGHWVVAGHREVFELARSAEYLSNDHDVNNERRGYKGITIPTPESMKIQGGFLEMDPPAQRHYRQALNPYLSPAAVSRWTPVIDELVRACLNEKIETGRIDFVDDLANVVPAVLTLAMLGRPAEELEHLLRAGARLRVHATGLAGDCRASGRPRWPCTRTCSASSRRSGRTRDPALIDALVRAEINGKTPADMELLGVIALLIGGGFDTTTALTAHALEWLSEHPAGARAAQPRARHAARLGDRGVPALLLARRRVTGARSPPTARSPAPSSGRASGCGCRGPCPTATRRSFPNPNQIDLARTGNRHHSFGLGHPPLHRVQRGAHGVQADAHRGARPDARLPLRSGRGRALRDDRRHPGDAAPAGDLHPRPADRGRPRRDDRPDAGASATSSGWPTRSPSARRQRRSRTNKPSSRTDAEFPSARHPLCAGRRELSPCSQAAEIRRERGRIRRTPASGPHPGERVLLDLGSGRHPAFPAVPVLLGVHPPAAAGMPVLPLPRAFAAAGLRVRHAHRVHRQPPVQPARPAGPVRGGAGRDRGRPPRAVHDQRRRVRPR